MDDKRADNVMNIDWIVKLRAHMRSPKRVSKEDVTKPEPFPVFYKSSKRESRAANRGQLLLGGKNMNEIIHMATDRRMNPIPSVTELNHLINLRS